jgi:hypothetical protein
LTWAAGGFLAAFFSFLTTLSTVFLAGCFFRGFRPNIDAIGIGSSSESESSTLRRFFFGFLGETDTLSPKKYWITWISEKIEIVVNAQRFLTGSFMLKW